MLLVALEEVKKLVSRETIFGSISAWTLLGELDKLPKYKAEKLRTRVVTDKMEESLFSNEMERDAYIKREQAITFAELLVGDGILVRSKKELGILGCTEYTAQLTVLLPEMKEGETVAGKVQNHGTGGTC